MLAIPHHSQVLSMAEIDSKEAQKKLKAGICFRITSHNKHTWFKLSQKKHKLQVQEKKTSAINRAFSSTFSFVTLSSFNASLRTANGTHLHQRKYLLDLLKDAGLTAATPTTFPLPRNL
ncbi:hypothetical protein Tco_1014585 [Tanacetum coccineum]